MVFKIKKMRKFINAASKDDFEALKEEIMRHSKKSQDAFVLACISLACNFAICLYLILTQ